MNLLATGKRACHDKPMCILRITLVSVVLLTCSLPPAASGNTAAQPAAAPNAQEPKKAIEQFLSLTAIWMLELEWTHAYVNKTPKAEDFRKAMLAAGLQDCPADFQEAWLKQAAKPGRNYAAPVLRKYGISLKDLRERLQGSLFRINPGVRPPIPLYDEEEKIPRMDPRTCGNPKDILKALAALRAQVMGLTPAQLEKAARSIERSCWNSRSPTWKPPSAGTPEASGKARSGSSFPPSIRNNAQKTSAAHGGMTCHSF